MSRIGVLTSGGDAPGMNAAIRAVVRSGVSAGYEVLGIRRGYNGLISGDIVELDAESVNGIITRGGTMLYTARSPEFHTEAGLKRAADTCKYMGIEYLVVIGGDGTFRGGLDFSRYGVPVYGIPATIDNDIGCTNYSIGFDTASNTALNAIDKLRDTMQSHERCSVVEVMGRHAGHLALYVGIACGANSVLVPEYPVDFENDVTEKIRKGRLNGRTHFMFIIAEGVGDTAGFAERIREETGLDPRVTILGHVQRGGSPTARDRVTATRMGDHAIRVIEEDKKNRVICTQNGDVLDLDIEEALSMKKGLQPSLPRTLANVT